MFATDRDLLVLEPRLFSDVSWATQTLLAAANGAIDSAGTMLTVSGASFTSLGIDEGFIALVAGVPLEVISRESATELIVSKLRATVNDSPIRTATGTNLAVFVGTFRPQIALVHEQLLRALGIAPDPPGVQDDPNMPTESRITNRADLALAEALGALHLIYASAAAMAGSESPQWTKALNYRDRFMAERRRLIARLDLDGDGTPEVFRRASVLQFLRA